MSSTAAPPTATSSMGLKIKLETCIKVLLSDSPLLGCIMQNLDRREDSRIDTLGVGFSKEDGRIVLVYNPEFIDAMSPDLLVKVLLPHEIGHIVNGHLDRYVGDLHKALNHKVVNIAMDMAVNNDGFIDMSRKDDIVAAMKAHFGPESDGIVLPELIKAPEKQTSDYYLNRLFEEAEKNTSGQGESMFNDMGSDGQGEGSGQPGDGQSGEGQPGDGPGRPQVGIGDKGNGGQHPFLREEDGVSKNTRQSITESTLRQAYKDWANNHGKSRGNTPGGVSELIEQILFPKKSAAQVFRNLIGQWIGSRWELSSARINKRQGNYANPGKKLRPRLRLALVVDTSGSMSASHELAMFRGLVERTQRELDAELIIMHTDTEVCKVETLRGHKAPVNFHGRGGTDFTPAFRYLRNKKIRPDGVIFFTDGCGALEPDAAKGFRTAWFITPGGTTYDFMKARSMTIVQLEACKYD